MQESDPYQYIFTSSQQLYLHFYLLHFNVHRFNQHLTGPYYTQLVHKAQPTHSYMAQMLVIMDVRYDICKTCLRYVVYSLWKVRCKVKDVHDLAIETQVVYK